MSYLKTKASNDDVTAYLNTLLDESKRNDCFQLMEMMRSITAYDPKMWGKRIVGFGSYTYKTKAGKIGEWFLTGFTPTKATISLHLMHGLENETELLSTLGVHKMGKGCLYIKKLADVELDILKVLIKKSFERAKNTTI